jgi:hypothetical protein
MMTNEHAHQAPTPVTPPPSQIRIWQELRLRYHEHQDLFSTQELARLRFLRWLVHTGRLAA